MKKSFFSRRGLNLDISYRCPLECLRCQRQIHHKVNNEPVPGEDLSLENFNKLTNFYRNISFCGQLSDPIHHPEFLKFLSLCYDKKITVKVHTASSFKTKEWFVKAWKANPYATWVFGIDGLPEQSNIYRVNQDGEKLFKIMIESKKYLKTKPIWQFILFSYNEDYLDSAIEMAKNEGVEFLVKNSGRWDSLEDWLIPTVKK